MAIEIAVIGERILVFASHKAGVRGSFDSMVCECSCGWHVAYRLTGDPAADTRHLARTMAEHECQPYTLSDVEAVEYLAKQEWCDVSAAVIDNVIDLMAWCERELISELMRMELLAFVGKLGALLNTK